jgi:hypothetical protein
MEETTVLERSGDIEVIEDMETCWFMGPPIELIGVSLILCVEDEVGVLGPGPLILFS